MTPCRLFHLIQVLMDRLSDGGRRNWEVAQQQQQQKNGARENGSSSSDNSNDGFPVRTPTVVNIENKLNSKFDCPFCGKSFVHRWMLERHQLTHSGQQPYKCNQCGRRFSVQSSAIRHVKNVHKNELAATKEKVSDFIVKEEED